MSKVKLTETNVCQSCEGTGWTETSGTRVTMKFPCLACGVYPIKVIKKNLPDLVLNNDKLMGVIYRMAGETGYKHIATALLEEIPTLKLTEIKP